MSKDGMFVIGIFIFIFIAWIVTGGPNHPISWAGPFLNPPAPLGSGKAYFLSGAGFPSGNSSTGVTIGTSNAHLSLSDPAVPSSYFTNPSPYRGKVYFSTNPSSAEQTNPNLEYVSIVVASDVTQPIDVTGWRLISAHTNGPLPQGAAVPAAGSVNTTGDIVLRAGDTAYITSGYSPIGVSFRENECSGYLGLYQTFTPPLGGCAPEGFCDSGLTYNQCVAQYSGDARFASKTWHVYLNSREDLWGDRTDSIRLVDLQGRTVDVFSY